MEHVTITPMENGYYRMQPHKGYALYSKIDQKEYKDVVTKNIEDYSVVKL